MKLTFLGATHEVTGSCTLIESGDHRIIVDIGMEQGGDIFENADLPVSPAQIDAVVLTHTHVDHIGKLPLLFKNGFDGPVYATDATKRLAAIMLSDCAHIQEQDAEWKSRKAKRAGKPPVEPLYTLADAAAASSAIIPSDYNTPRRILENAEVCFHDAGHLLGSSSVELRLTESGEQRTVVFSGDIGNINRPLIRDPAPVVHADYLIIESTYGDRLHEMSPETDRTDYAAQMARLLTETFKAGGNVVIPAFAVGRSQEILFYLRHIKENNMIPEFPNFPVYIDSPLANQATSVFLQSERNNFDDETRALIDEGINPIFFDGLKISETAEDSKAINADPTPKVIISASGMCEAGRIRHHLKHNLWRSESTILFVGYQANGTLGRLLVDGADEVRLFSETISVKARIEVLAGVSGHADRNGLLAWYSHISPQPRAVFVNHGEDSVCDSFANLLKADFGANSFAPYSGSVYDLIADKWENIATGKRLTTAPAGATGTTGGADKADHSSGLFGRLIAATRYIASLSTRFEGRPNRDIKEFAEDAERLGEKWRKRL